MNCKYHNDKPAKYICEKCKKPICEECSIDVMGKKVCNSCVSYSVFETKPEKRDSLLEKFVFFCFNVIPGAGQMYLGMFKRGFQLMVTFIGGITILAYAGIESFLPLAIIPIWFYSFFDGYYIRKRLKNGEFVDDLEVFSYSIFTGNKLYVGIVFLLMGIMGLINVLDFGDLIGRQAGQFYWMFKRSLVPLAFILVGAVVLIRSKKAETKSEELEE